MTTTEVVLAVAALVAGSGALATYVGKLVPQRVSTADRMDKLENRSRLLEDYIYELRAAVESAGGVVPAWPKELTHAA